MPLYREVNTGELEFSDDLIQIDTGEFTIPEMYREAILDDALSDMPLYEEVDSPEQFPVFIEWCKQRGWKANSYNAVISYTHLLKVFS